jgi:hypothetical protein
MEAYLILVSIAIPAYHPCMVGLIVNRKLKGSTAAQFAEARRRKRQVFAAWIRKLEALAAMG